MEGNNFIFDFIGSILQSKSKKQIKEDIKNMGDIKLPLVGTLSHKTKAQLKQDIASLNGTISLTGKVDSKGIATSVQQATQQAQRQVDSKPVEVAFSVKKEKLLNDIKLLAQQNSRLFKNSDMSIKYNSLLDNAEMARNSVELSALRTQLGSFRSELKVTGNAGLTMTDALKNGLYKVFQLFGSHGIIVQFTAQLRKAWTEAKELDKSMTDLSRVNEEITRSGFPDYLDKVISKTKQLAVATKDYIDAVTTFSRAGYNLADSETLADMAVQLEKVGDMSAVDASKALLAGLQGYNEIDGYGMDQLTEKAQALNDKIDLIGNTASITQAELSQGIQAVGSVMNDANTSVDEFLALLGAGNRAVQDSDKVALAIRTSALRIRGCTAELEEMGEETDSVVESTSKLAEKIEGLTNINGSGGVKILEADEETFRSIYDIYNDIAKVYDQMSDKDASALLDLIAGKNRSNQISAILQNMSEANELLEKSLSATGTASAEYQIYLDSAQAATERFGVAMTETYSNIISGDTVKGLANAGTAVLDFANSWNILEGTIRGFLALGILKGVTTLTVAFKNSALQISNYGKALDAVKQIGVYAQGTEKYAKAMDTLKSSCVNLTDAQLKQVLANRNLEKSQLIEILQLKTLKEEERETRLAQLGLTQATVEQTAANGAATASTFSLKSAITGLGASLKAAWMTNPIGIIIMGISTAIGVLTSAISKHNQKLEEMRDKAKESADKANTLSNEIAELTNKYLLLSEAVKTDASAKEDLITTQTELLKKLGLEGESIDTLIEKYGSLSNAIKQASIDSLKNAQIDLIAGVSAAQEELLDVAKDNFWGTNNIISATGEDAVKAFKVLEKAGIVNSGSFGSAGGSLVLTGDETVDGALENFKKLEDAINALRDSSEFTMSELSNNSLFQAIYDRYNEMKNGVDSYNSSIENLNANLSQQIMLTALQGQEVPKTEEEFNTFRQELIDTAVASKQFIGNEEDITEAIDGYLSTVPEFEGYYSVPLENELNKVDDLLSKKDYSKSISSSIMQIATQLEPEFSKLGEAYKEIFKLDDNGKETFNLSAVDNSMLEDIRQSFAEIKDEIGVTFDTSKLEPFFDTLTNGNSTAGQVQQAFNDLATAYLYSTDTLDHLNSETADAIALQLEELGVQNAAEIVADELKAKTEELTVAKEYLAQTGKELASATEEEQTAFILEQIEAGNCGEALALLQLKKMLVNGTLLDTSTDINNVLALAQAAGIATDALTRLQSLKAAFDNAQATGNYGAMNAISAEMSNVKTQIETDIANFRPVEIQFDSTSAEKSAKKAGKSAAESYVSAFQKELQEWKDLESQGKISHKQYLDALLRLVKKYFGDRKKYTKEYAQYMDEYLQGYLDLYNKALSGISTLLNQKINAANEAKDAAVSALQEEKEKAAEVYQSQIDNIEKEKEAIDDLIKEKNKKIDSLNEEAEAIRKASEERKRDIELQDAQRRKAQAENQRVELKYSQDKGFYYDVNTEEIRKANEDIAGIQEEMQIAELEKQVDLIQKEIDLLEEKKDSLSDEQDRIQKLLDESNKYYDNLIKQQEKMWDSMIKNMEQQKSRWEELAEIQEIAEAFSYIQQVFGDLGYTVEDVLNGSDAAFEDFKSRYISLISDVNSNSDFTEGLVYATGVAKENLGSFLEKTKETADGLSELGEKGSGMDSVAESMDKLSDSATTASEGTSSIATSMGELSTSTEGISDNLTSINDAITDLPEADKLDGLAAKFTNLGKAIQAVADVLGIGEEGVVSTLVSALQEISTLSLDGSGGEEGSGNSGGGIISQFKSLKTAVEDVTSAISGGRSSGSKEGDASDSSSESMSFGVNGEGADGLISAIEEIKPATDESLGGDGESSGTIPQFQELKTAVDDVTAAIGTADTEGGALSESTTLIGALRAQYETAFETLPETTALFEELLESIMSCVGALNSMVSLMGSMSEIGGFGSHNISVTPDAKDAGGNAHANGTGNSGITEKHVQLPTFLNEWDRMEKLAEALGRDVEDLLNPLSSIALDIKKETGVGRFMESISNVNNVTNNNNKPSVTIGDIRVTCPGVTEQQVAQHIGGVLKKELDKEFSGFYNYTDQMSRIRR